MSQSELPTRAFSVDGSEALDPGMLTLYARAIEQSGRYRLVQRFERRPCYHPPDSAPVSMRRRAVFVDVETTGLDHSSDEIIQLAVLPFEYNHDDGRIYGVEECATYLEAPTIPIPPEITELTGISDADVRGQRIDDSEVKKTLQRADLVIAHNACFDRCFLERRLPDFRSKPWACSREDVPWGEHGFSSTKLEWLAYKLCGMFYEAHRADSDCYMAVHLLASTLPSGDFVMGALLRSARQTTVRLSAVGAPFEMKDRLKQRGYRWDDGNRGMPKAWWKVVTEEGVAAEQAWLASHIYRTERPRYACHRIDATTRYSARH